VLVGSPPGELASVCTITAPLGNVEIQRIAAVLVRGDALAFLHKKVLRQVQRLAAGIRFSARSTVASPLMPSIFAAESYTSISTLLAPRRDALEVLRPAMRDVQQRLPAVPVRSPGSAPARHWSS